MNKSEIAGKRGLIQRAVDSYRNRYPSMRSRRVARQEKLLNGTLRKRKNREDEDETSSNSTSISSPASVVTSTPPQPFPTSLEAAIVKPAHQPKTVAIDDPTNNTRYRIKISIESISLDEITEDFRKQNCAFPRAVQSTPEQYAGGRARWLEDSMINELGWKLVRLKEICDKAVYLTYFFLGLLKPSCAFREEEPSTESIGCFPHQVYAYATSS